MKLDRRLILLGVLVLATGVAVYLRGTPAEDSPEHRVGSDAANGTSALKQLAEVLGHPTVTLQDTFTPDLGMRVLFVFTPRTGFTKQEARRLSDYASGGGVVVYAAEEGDPQLDATLHVERQSTLVSGEGTAAGPMLSGVQRVSGGAAVRPLVPHTSQVVVLRGGAGQPIAFEELVGRGRIVTLTDPLPLCNGYLGAADNGRLASDLLSLAGGGGSVAFDEYHHQVPGPTSPVTAWLSTSWGASLTWAVVVLFIGLLIRGRAFGPRLELPGGGDRSTAEYVAAIGHLLQRSRAVGVTAEVLRDAARRAVAHRHGIGATGGTFQRSLAQRAPQEAQELAAAEAMLAAADREETLLVAARRLRALAYPDLNPPSPCGEGKGGGSRLTGAQFHSCFQSEVGKALVGQEEAVRLCALAVVVRGHVLLEGVPGVGKTLLAKAIARLLALEYTRVQFTPDLMPADIVGTSVYDLQTRTFNVRPGPVFTNVLLADEINRAPAKVQAALLEAMEERGVSLEGRTRPLPDPFIVLATQNPVEYEGTYPLPEAQQDRFLFKVTLGYPTADQEMEMLARWDAGIELRDPERAGVRQVLDTAALDAVREQAAAIRVDEEIRRYIVRLAEASRSAPELALGASPRAEVLLMQAAKAQATFEDRQFVTPDDVKSLLAPAFRHRLILRPEAEVAGQSADSVLTGLAAQVTPPR